jgi:hypothetical protein
MDSNTTQYADAVFIKYSIVAANCVPMLLLFVDISLWQVGIFISVAQRYMIFGEIWIRG